MKKRKRNELSYAQSGGAMIHTNQVTAVKIDEPPTAVFLQHSENSDSTIAANPVIVAASGARGKMSSTDDRKQYLT